MYPDIGQDECPQSDEYKLSPQGHLLQKGHDHPAHYKSEGQPEQVSDNVVVVVHNDLQALTDPVDAVVIALALSHHLHSGGVEEAGHSEHAHNERHEKSDDPPSQTGQLIVRDKVMSCRIRHILRLSQPTLPLVLPYIEIRPGISSIMT